MRTITVPKKYGYPTLDITVNGKEYTVKSGEEITVEDSVAEAIENAVALAPKIGVPKSKLVHLIESGDVKITAEDLAGITALRRCAFYDCGLLTSVELPDTVTKILDNAFAYCGGLSEVYLPETPPTLGTMCFTNVPTTCTFYCKTQESLEAYKAATNWSELAKTFTFAVSP